MYGGVIIKVEVGFIMYLNEDNMMGEVKVMGVRVGNVGKGYGGVRWFEWR